MHVRWLPFALAIALVTSGCIGLTGDEAAPQSASTPTDDAVGPVDVSEVSKPVHELDSVVETFLPSHDGVELHSVAYHPNVSDGEKTPVVIHLSPYMGNLDDEAQAQHDSYWTQLLVQRGYTVVHASVRGTGYSGGCFQLGGPTEIQDTYELVEHYHEADWSNGNVSLIGVSYPGTTPWQAAIADPPGLKTVVPMEGISDMYKYDHINGASYTHGPAFPTYYTAIVDWTLVPRNADGPQYALPPLDAFCPGAAERILEGYKTMADGKHDAFWDVRDYEAQVDRIDVPVFLVQGFQDWNVDPNNGIPIFDELPDGSKAWLGQWAHEVPFSSFDEDAERHDWNLTLTAWFDRWLKGHDTGITERKPVLAQDTDHRWFRTETWPPEDREPVTFYPAADGELERDVPEQGTVHMAKDPTNEVGEPPTDAHEVRGDEGLTFTSDPLGEDTLIAGSPTVTLNVSIDERDGHLVADLYERDGDERAWLGHAITNLAQRDSRDEHEPMPSGFVTVELTFVPMNAHVPGNHSLELEIRPEAPDWILPAPENPSYTIKVGGEDPASLTIPDYDGATIEQAPEKGEVPFSE